jgi:hypothetical protein
MAFLRANFGASGPAASLRLPWSSGQGRSALAASISWMKGRNARLSALLVGESHRRESNSGQSLQCAPEEILAGAGMSVGDEASRRMDRQRSRPRRGRQFYTAQLQVQSPPPMAPARASGQPLGCHLLNTLAAFLRPATSLRFRCGKVGHILLRVRKSWLRRCKLLSGQTSGRRISK